MVREKYESSDQEDVAEFILDLLEFLDEIYQETYLEEHTPIKSHFSIKNTEHVTCPDCLTTIMQPIATEKILSCPAPRQGETNILVGELICRTFETEIVERRCRNCLSDIQRVTHTIDGISDTLVIQISRFTNDSEKIRASIALEEKLKL